MSKFIDMYQHVQDTQKRAAVEAAPTSWAWPEVPARSACRGFKKTLPGAPAGASFAPGLASGGCFFVQLRAFAYSLPQSQPPLAGVPSRKQTRGVFYLLIGLRPSSGRGKGSLSAKPFPPARKGWATPNWTDAHNDYHGVAHRRR